MKQRGAVLAKGRLLGLQFQALLKDGLYWELARRANEMAFRLRDGLSALGCAFPLPSPTNQRSPYCRIRLSKACKLRDIALKLTTRRGQIKPVFGL